MEETLHLLEPQALLH